MWEMLVGAGIMFVGVLAGAALQSNDPNSPKKTEDY
jgi:hypothetical protein